MILAALNDYYQRLLAEQPDGVPQLGYSQEKISYAIVLDESGEVLDVLDERTESGKKRQPRYLRVPASFKRPGIGSKAFFLWDKASYVLGVPVQSEDPEEFEKNKKRARLDHETFVSFHQSVLAECSDPGLNALSAFLKTWEPASFSDNPHFQRLGEDALKANFVFRLNDEQGYLHERPATRKLWASLQAGDDAEAHGICLVTGEEAPLARLHPAIKGVKGAQPAGASMVSFNLDAFTSYGKEQGGNAPISSDVAFGYTTALNHLLRYGADNRQRLQIGDTAVVFWAQAPDTAMAQAGEDLLTGFFDPSEDNQRATARLNDALKQVRQGRPLRDLGDGLEDGTRIYVLGLAPNASRLSIRFWETDTLDHFAKRLADHFDDLEIQPTPWKRAPSLRWLALATAPQHGDKAKPKAEDIPPLLAGELTRAVLTGSRYPHNLLSTLVMRFRADGQVTGIRVALCKAVLARAARLDNKQGPSNHQGELPVSLDITCTDQGYLLGRLFAALENVQRAALGDRVNATIRDRYYGSASATPANVFPILVRNVQNHFSKLGKDKKGLAITLEKEVGGIVSALPPAFPRHLDMDDQGRFAIGYYHQKQSRFANKDDHGSTDNDSEGENA